MWRMKLTEGKVGQVGDDGRERWVLLELTVRYVKFTELRAQPKAEIEADADSGITYRT